MRGDIIGVWSETWREIWTPLIEQQDVPEDVFCELYRELASALRAPTDEEAVALVVSDAIQLREAFELVPVRAKSIIELAQVKDAFDASGATDLQEPAERRAAVERALTVLIGSASRVTTLLDQVLAGLAQDPQKRAEAKERSVDAVINNLETSRYAFERLPSRAFGGERALVAFLEAAPDVQSFAKNYLAVGFKLDYVRADGDLSTYTPDFLVKTTDGIVWIVETKGREELDLPQKMARLCQWCADATAAEDNGASYRFVYVDQQSFEQHVPQTFASLAASFNEYQEPS